MQTLEHKTNLQEDNLTNFITYRWPLPPIHPRAHIITDYLFPSAPCLQFQHRISIKGSQYQSLKEKPKAFWIFLVHETKKLCSISTTGRIDLLVSTYITLNTPHHSKSPKSLKKTCCSNIQKSFTNSFYPKYKPKRRIPFDSSPTNLIQNMQLCPRNILEKWYGRDTLLSQSPYGRNQTTRYNCTNYTQPKSKNKSLVIGQPLPIPPKEIIYTMGPIPMGKTQQATTEKYSNDPRQIRTFGW